MPAGRGPAGTEGRDTGDKERDFGAAGAVL